MAAPKVGQIIDGYRFLGGNHKDPNSWQPAGVEEIAAAKTAGAAEGKMQGRASAPVNQNAFNDAANQLKDVRGARQSAGFWNTGMIGNMTASHPDGNGKTGLFSGGIAGTPGYNLDKDLTTIRSRIMFANLAKMKAASANGASGLGALSIPEGEALKSTVSSLDVGLPAGQLRQNLDRVREDVILNNPGVNIDNPYDLSQGQSRETIPRNAYYRDAQGNIRQNKNGDKGNPIVRPGQGAPPQQSAPQGPQNAFASAKPSGSVRTYNPKTGALE
jgi:hypothetical protein